MEVQGPVRNVPYAVCEVVMDCGGGSSGKGGGKVRWSWGVNDRGLIGKMTLGQRFEGSQ